MELWIVIIEDRHTDVEVLPFSSEEKSIEVARDHAGTYEVIEAELTLRAREDGWVFLLEYGIEGDCVRVVKRTLDG